MKEITDFENCLSLGNDYAEQLLPKPNRESPLSIKGPMSRSEAIAFFYRCRLDTHPLYILEKDDAYFAFY